MFVNDSMKRVPSQASYKKESKGEEFKEEEASPFVTDLVDPAGSKFKDGNEMSTNPNQMEDMEANEKGSKDNGNRNDKKSKEEEQPLEKNADFADLEKTGRWGQVSKTEVYIVAIVMILIVVGVVVALVVFLGDGGSKDDNDDQAEAAELTPILTPDQQMELIRSTLNDNALTVDALGNGGVDFFNIYLMAANWVVDVDAFDRQADIMPRYALAAFYYATEGVTWDNDDGWLLDTDVCDGWLGVSCDKSGNVVELDLSGNNLRGNFPAGPLSLLKSLETIRLNNNVLKGNLTDVLFEDMPNLQFLYIQHNRIGGPIPETFLTNGKLRTIFLQHNRFVGTFPDIYCPTCEDCEPPLFEFGIDCQDISFPNEYCFDPDLNCFY